MKFQPALSFLAFASTAFASPIQYRNALTSPIASLEIRQIDSKIPTVRWINSVTGGILSIKLAVKNYNGDLNPIRTAELNLNEDMAEGTRAIRRMFTLGASDATVVYSELSKLQTLIEDLVYDTTEKKYVFQQTNNRYYMHTLFEKQIDGYRNFLDAITAKMPDNLRSLTIKTSTAVLSALQKGSEAFR